MFKKKKKKTGQRRWLITDMSSKSSISEQYRTIRTNIQFSGADKDFKSIVITSAEPEEGKSTTVANLAIVFAQQGKKVLIVDADMRKPTLQYTFNLPNLVGLTTVLTRQADLDQAVAKTNIDNLSALTCGPIPPNPAELLTSNSMVDLLEKVTADFDIVLFDTPPILAVADAQILANICDGSILVIRSGKTDIDKVTKAKELLETAKGKFLGAVLNNQKMQKGSYYYYYGTK